MTSTVDNQNVSALLELEAMARRAESEKALQFLIVNETRRLLNYRQALLFSSQGETSFHAEAASSLSMIDKDAPMITWLESFISRQTQLEETRQLGPDDASEEDRQRFEEFSFQHVVWCPLKLSDGLLVGGFWLARETAWQSNELILIERLCETYAHAWAALAGKKKFSGMSVRRKKIIGGVLAGLIVISLLPVRLSTIAPAEIVPLDPIIVSAPMDGVIRELPVPPNSPVAKGDVLFRYEDTNLRNSYDIAQQTLNVTTARLRQASQGAFADDSSRGQVALLQAEKSLKETELAYAKELLAQVDVTAQQDGLLVYSDASDWVGKPVVVGERVMEIVDPDRVQFRIYLPVDDAIVLQQDNQVDVFLHANPLTSIQARVSKTSYNAKLTPDNILAYRIDAEFDQPSEDARLGLQGSARVYGERVTVFFYVFRRPISALRQIFGI